MLFQYQPRANPAVQPLNKPFLGGLLTPNQSYKDKTFMQLMFFQELRMSCKRYITFSSSQSQMTVSWTELLKTSLGSSLSCLSSLLILPLSPSCPGRPTLLCWRVGCPLMGCNCSCLCSWSHPWCWSTGQGKEPLPKSHHWGFFFQQEGSCSIMVSPLG